MRQQHVYDIMASSTNILAVLGRDVRDAFRDRTRRWMTASVLLYFVLLPFNAFGIRMPWVLPVLGPRVKFTELALFLVLVMATHAVITRRLTIVRAPVLYALLALNAVAQFTALPFAANRPLLLAVGIAVARYSVLVFLLVNVLRSDRIIRAALTAMALSCTVIIAVTTAHFLVPGSLPLADYTIAVGRSTTHVLAYALILFGTGIVYLFVRGQNPRWMSVAMVILLVLWMQLVFTAYVKIAQVVLVVFLVVFVATLAVQRWRAILLLGLGLLTFAMRYHQVALQDRADTWVRESAAQIAVLRVALPQRSEFPVRGDAVAQAFRATGDTLIAAGKTVRSTSATIAVAAPIGVALAPSDAASVFSPAAEVTAASGAETNIRAPAPTPVPAPLPVTSTLPLAAQAGHVPAPVIVPLLATAENRYYQDANRARLNWVKSRSENSLDLRKRGLALGWVVGRTYPMTGIGPGQLRDMAVFDAFSERVRAEARESSVFPWKRFFFRDQEVPAAIEDKGIFNIFMNAWAETGAPGLLALLGLLAVVTVQGIRGLLRSWRLRVVAPIIVLFPLFCALLLYHQTVYLWVHPWFWTMLALTYAAARVARDEQRQVQHVFRAKHQAPHTT